MMHGRPALRDVAKSPCSPALVPKILGSKFVLRNTVRNSRCRGILYPRAFSRGRSNPQGLSVARFTARRQLRVFQTISGTHIPR